MTERADQNRSGDIGPQADQIPFIDDVILDKADMYDAIIRIAGAMTGSNVEVEVQQPKPSTIPESYDDGLPGNNNTQNSQQAQEQRAKRVSANDSSTSKSVSGVKGAVAAVKERAVGIDLSKFRPELTRLQWFQNILLVLLAVFVINKYVKPATDFMFGRVPGEIVYQYRKAQRTTVAKNFVNNIGDLREDFKEDVVGQLPAEQYVADETKNLGDVINYDLGGGVFGAYKIVREHANGGFVSELSHQIDEFGNKIANTSNASNTVTFYSGLETIPGAIASLTDKGLDVRLSCFRHSGSVSVEVFNSNGKVIGNMSDTVDYFCDNYEVKSSSGGQK